MPSSPYSLTLQTPVKLGTPKYVDDLTYRARNWRRSIRSRGGPWQGSFIIDGTYSQLHDLFYTLLGYEVVEKVSGNTTWVGMIYEIDFIADGTRRRRSLDTMYNYMYVTYTDSATGLSTTTAAASQLQSIARYGRRENIVTLGKLVAAAATGARDSNLKEFAWPWARPVSIGRNEGRAALEITVCGYVFTTNWRYLSATTLNNTTQNASTFVTNIRTNDISEFITGVNIPVANTSQVVATSASNIRAWDMLVQVGKLGDASGNPWEIGVSLDRVLYYRQIPTTPRYVWRNGRLFSTIQSSSPMNPYLVTPGVIRDINHPVTRAEQGSFLLDARDQFVDQVEVSPDGELAFSTSVFSPSEIFATRLSESGKF